MPYYGQNGFYLPFKNNASTTTLGWDYSNDVTAKYNATVAGNAQISTAQSKFGGSSALFDGTGDYLSIPNSTDFSFGTGNFTIEMWAYVAGNSSTNSGGIRHAALLSSLGTSTMTGLELFITGNTTTTGVGISFVNYVSSTPYSVGYPGTITQNTWHHISVVRDGTTTTIYLNGTFAASGTLGNQTINPVNNTWIAGSNVTGYSHFLNGYIDDLRIYKGVAKYTGNFTPTTSAVPLGAGDSNWQYCVLAMPMDGTNASTTFPVYRPNNWTPNNFSVTAGVGNDSMIDVPTRYADGGNNRGNYCTINSAIIQTQYAIITPSSIGGTLSNGNLDVLGQASNWNGFVGTISVNSGKWYWEVTNVAEPTANYSSIGIVKSQTTTAYSPNGNLYVAGDVLGFALDLDAGTFVWYRNGVSQATLATGLTGEWLPWCSVANSNSLSFNFGQRPFQYTPPTGFKAINTYNLP